MGNLVYLFAAYAVFWVLTFAFVFNLARRQKGLQREIGSLKRALETRQEESGSLGLDLRLHLQHRPAAEGLAEENQVPGADPGDQAK